MAPNAMKASGTKYSIGNSGKKNNKTRITPIPINTIPPE
jgi:hypothetical protein